MLKDKMLIDSVKSQEGIKLIVDWIKSHGRGSDCIEVEQRNPTTILIKTKVYSTTDNHTYRLSENSWSNTVTISTDSVRFNVTINPLSSWKSKYVSKKKSKKYEWDIFSQDHDIKGSWADDSMYDQGFYVPQPILDFEVVYYKDRDLTTDLRLFIQSIPSILRDRKINTILDDNR